MQVDIIALVKGEIEMLEQKDLDAIRQIVGQEVDSRIARTEDFMLDEIGRTQTYLEGQIEKVARNIEELNQYYRITKLENDNTTLLLRMVEQLSKRVEELEKKSA